MKVDWFCARRSGQVELALVCSRLWGVAALGRRQQVQAAVRDQLVSYGIALPRPLR